MKTNSVISILFSLGLLACNHGPYALHLGGDDKPKSGGFQNKPTQEATISFDQVLNTSLQSCAECHGGGDDDPDLIGYNDYRLHMEDIYESVVVTRKMPKRKKLSEEQIKLVKDWIEQGAPQFIPNQPPGAVTTTTTTTTTLPPEISTTTTTTLAPVPTTTSTTVPVVNPPVGLNFDTVLKASLQSCSKCHSAGDDEPTLETYRDYKNNINDIMTQVVVKKKMPKKEKLTADQIRMVKDWIDQGAQEF